MSTTPAKASEPATPTPTPISEEMSGRLAESSEPSITMSTMAAMSRPMTSPGPISPSTPLAISDE